MSIFVRLISQELFYTNLEKIRLIEKGYKLNQIRPE